MELTIEEKKYGKEKKIVQKTLLSIKRALDCDNWIEEFELNPYQLMKVSGYGFKRCDDLAIKIGFDLKSPIRVNAYITTAIEGSTKGDSILGLEVVMKKIENELDVERGVVISTIFMYDGEYVLLDGSHKSLTKKDILNGMIPFYITKKEWFDAEKFVFNYAKRLAKQPSNKIDYNIVERILQKNKTLNPKQKDVVERILEKNFNLIIGSSGSGKSYVTKVVLDLMDCHNLSYTLLAPTGIASFNLSEKTERETSTIHRKYYQKQLIDTDYVIVDEVGMCGYSHFNMLNEMIINKDKTKVIFIGDKYQLPSISAGDFLSSIMNLITKKVIDGNVFELTQVMRASDDKDITTVCNLFCGNNVFDSGIMAKKLNGVEFVNREFDLFGQIDRLIKNNEWKWKETAIIMPQRKGEFGCDSFNVYFQSKNHNEVFFENKFKCYKKHDILMHIKNNSKLNIYNGEMVELIDFSDGEYLARKLYDNTELYYDEETLSSETTLGYSFTVHKSQGCTIKNVVFVGIREFSYMLSRNLMYVGMSRASENLVVICDKDVIVKSSYKNLTDKRKTFLNLLCE